MQSFRTYQTGRRFDRFLGGCCRKLGSVEVSQRYFGWLGVLILGVPYLASNVGISMSKCLGAVAISWNRRVMKMVDYGLSARFSSLIYIYVYVYA